tara:strand:+ start:105 stop:224 length:120 start_codon:yes stop_codon:yes gene_type:complete
MREIKELIMEDPGELFGSIAVLLLMFGGFYVAIHIGCPC